MPPVAVNNDEKASRAKRWGTKHGYYGRSGGWIYHTSTPETQLTFRNRPFGDTRKPICH